MTATRLGESQSGRPIPAGQTNVAATLGNKIVLWGGAQRDSDGNFSHLSKNLIFTLQLSEGVWEWKTLEARGDIHPGQLGAAFAVHQHAVYIMGGYTEGLNPTDAVSTLKATGRFRQIHSGGVCSGAFCQIRRSEE